jgi:UDP-N-acetyl-D-glucosamine dehydrogenase
LTVASLKGLLQRGKPGTPVGRAEIAIVGAGYVGVPLAHVFASAGRSVLLVDVVEERVAALNRGESHIEDVPSQALKPLVEAERLSATTDYDGLREVDAIVIALPTPLSAQRERDLSIVLGAAAEIAPRLQRGQLVVLESTTYPGTTRERLQPILESSGLRAGTDFNLAFSPERVDPGRADWTTKNTTKIVGGITPACTERAVQLYESALESVVAVSSPEAAELTKLLENIFRSVNIALVNELAQLCDRMGIDVWEVVGAAATKPFGFMSFQPGPGLGGHCMPIDPFYLTWKAREYDFYTEFIELAGKVNENMPWWCLGKIVRALNSQERALKGSKVLVLGVSYKADIDDTRESPALKLIELLHGEGADVSYHDANVPELPEQGLTSGPLDIGGADCVVIVTAHSGIDYDDLVERAKLVVDLRNATGSNGAQNGKVWKL